MSEEKKEIRLGKEQIEQSLGYLDAAKRVTSEELQAIKLKNELYQKKSRSEEDERSLQRSNEIQQEAINSNKQNSALEMKWLELKELEEPEELNKEIKALQDKFNTVMNEKNNLIKEFWDELKKKDDEYVKMLKEQAEDIKNMIKLMRKQFYEIRDENLKQLDNIESKFETDRKNLLKIHGEIIDKLFEDHAAQENKYVTQHNKNEEDFTQQIEEIRIQGAKNYAELKITMESEIQNLEKCLEDMKALYILNTEKLDYNLKVLKEKNNENSQLSDELKRKNTNLDNRLRTLSKEFTDFNKKFMNQNKLYTQEYKRITKQFKELQRKYKHFVKADKERYDEISKMNEDEVKKLKEGIIKCDITIHHQQLGDQWIPPKAEDQQAFELQEKSKMQSSSYQQEVVEEEEEAEVLKVNEDKIVEIIEIILKQGDFLIDDRMREDLIGKGKEEQVTQRLNTIKKCLGIDSFDEMNIFFEQFVRFCRIKPKEEEEEDLKQQVEQGEQQGEQQDQSKKDEKKDGKKDEEKEGKKSKKDKDKEKEKEKQELELQQQRELEEQRKMEEEKNLDLNIQVIDENLVVDFLIDWMDKKDIRKNEIQMMSTKKHVKQETEREKKERMARLGKSYWEKLTQVLPPRTFRVWKVLDKALSKYYQLLLNRQKLIEETGDLHNQNEELKNLLNQYLQINHELIIPPTRLINLESNQ